MAMPSLLKLPQNPDSSLKNGNIDAIIATMTITEERKNRSIFPMSTLMQDNLY